MNNRKSKVGKRSDGSGELDDALLANCNSRKTVGCKTSACKIYLIYLLISFILAVQVLESNYSLLALPDKSISGFLGIVNGYSQSPPLSTLTSRQIPTSQYYQYSYSTATATPSINHPPTAYPGAASTRSDTPVLVTLRATDEDGDPLTFFPALLSTKTSHGELGPVLDYSTSSTMTTARLTYLPDPGYSGSDTFSYQAVDKSNTVSNVAIINLFVSN
jgi:hypothetical protein